MAKTKWWLAALVTVLIVLVLAAGGYALYRIGYARGMQANIVEKGLPQKFLDQFNRLERDGRPHGVIPRQQLREFGGRILSLERGLGRPGLFPWRMIIPIAVVVILAALAIVLAVVLLTRRNPSNTIPPVPLQSQEQSPLPKE